MFERDKPSAWVRVLLSFVLLAVVIGGGYAVYRFGFAQGAVAADGGEFMMDNWTAYPMMKQNYSPYARGFSPFGSLFFGLIFLMLLFGIFRRLIFGSRSARWGYGPHGYHGHPGHHRYHDCGPEGKGKKNGEKVPVDEESPE